MESPGPSGSKFDDRNNDNDIENVPDTEVLEALRRLEAIREKTAEELARDDMEGILGSNAQKVEDEIERKVESIKQKEKEELNKTGIPRFVRERQKDIKDFETETGERIDGDNLISEKTVLKDIEIINHTDQNFSKELVFSLISKAKDILEKSWVRRLSEADFASMDDVERVKLESFVVDNKRYTEFKVYLVQKPTLFDRIINHFFKEELVHYAEFVFYVDDKGDVRLG